MFIFHGQSGVCRRKGLHYMCNTYKYFLRSQILRGPDTTPTQPVISTISIIKCSAVSGQKSDGHTLRFTIMRVSTQFTLCVPSRRAVLPAAWCTRFSGWPQLEVLAFWAAYQVATLVKAYVLEGNDGRKLGSQQSHFLFSGLTVSWLLAVVVWRPHTVIFLIFVCLNFSS